MREVLIACSETEKRRAISRHVEERGYQTVAPGGAEACIAHFRSQGTDAIVVCLPLDDVGGREILERLRATDQSVNVIVTGTDDQIAGPADAFAHGAFEYVDDPVDGRSDLLAALGLALGSRGDDVELRYFKEREARESRHDIIASCPAMRTVMNVVKLICLRTSEGGNAPTVLITGETGTGKGMLAKYIHHNGGRRTRPFVTVNCAAIPPQLLEAEVFGYERGAFTDARTRHIGLMETANGGTLFLDEVGTLPLSAQAKLLTAIEDKQVRRVGGVQPISVDTQIMAATHADLRALAARGQFRSDLYHRLNVVSVKLPPLRKRGDDIVHIAEHLVDHMCRSYGLPRRSIDDAAKAYLREHDWPGNIREMRNVVERVILMYDTLVIERQHFNAVCSVAPPPESDRLTVYLPEGGVSLSDVEKEVIEQALDLCEGNVSRTARYLRVTRQTLIYRMKKHKLSRVRD